MKRKATTKSTKATVNVWQSYYCSCPVCEESILIREDVRKGDELTCPNCESVRLTVDAIYADHRTNDGKAELNGDALGSFL